MGSRAPLSILFARNEGKVEPRTSDQGELCQVGGLFYSVPFSSP